MVIMLSVVFKKNPDIVKDNGVEQLFVVSVPNDKDEILVIRVGVGGGVVKEYSKP